jgi:hypothetical protein
MLSFAQYQRESTGERISHKVAASRKKGMWMGGWTPLGYEVRDRKLIIHEGDAARVRAIFKRFVQLKSATLLARELVVAGERNRYGHLRRSKAGRHASKRSALDTAFPSRGRHSD